MGVEDRESIATRLARWALAMPEPLLDRLIGAPPIEVDGRVLNRRVQALIVGQERLGMGGVETDVARRRADLRQKTRLAMPVRSGIHVWGRVIDGPGGPLPVRCYRRIGGPEVRPGIVYLHGGGWVVGDLDTHDACCRVLADVAGAVVVSVDYRLAPESPFPAAVDDSMAALAWVRGAARELGVDPARLGVMGDSAGGNLAAVVAQKDRDGDGPPLVVQGLVYPATDARFVTRSHDLFAEGFFLTRADMEWFRGHYLPNPDDWTDPAASPLLADDLGGCAPAVVVTAGFDPLRDEGDQYAERLRDAGVPVRWRCYDDQVHGFFGMGVLPDGMAVITEVCAAVGELLHR